MSSINYNANKRAIEQFRNELKQMVTDIEHIDKRVLNKAVNMGVVYAKNHSPVITGWYRKNWKSTPAASDRVGGISKLLINNCDYASFVNYGHRMVNKDGENVGYVKSSQGDHLLERTSIYVGKQIEKEFRKELEAVQRRHD